MGRGATCAMAAAAVAACTPAAADAACRPGTAMDADGSYTVTRCRAGALVSATEVSALRVGDELRLVRSAVTEPQGDGYVTSSATVGVPTRGDRAAILRSAGRPAGPRYLVGALLSAARGGLRVTIARDSAVPPPGRSLLTILFPPPPPPPPPPADPTPEPEPPPPARDPSCRVDDHRLASAAGGPLRWPDAAYGYRVNTDTVPAAFRRAIARGHDAWDTAINPCGLSAPAVFTTRDEGDTSAHARLDRDGRNTIDLGPLDALGERAEDAIAVTRVFWRTRTGAPGATIVEVDQRYEDPPSTSFCRCRWSTTGAAGAWDLAGLAAHEAGHALGLSHVASPSQTMSSAVTAGDIRWRDLGAGDLLGLGELYG